MVFKFSCIFDLHFVTLLLIQCKISLYLGPVRCFVTPLPFRFRQRQNIYFCTKAYVDCCHTNENSLHMNQLHWLPIQARIDFKIATLTYKALSSGQPAYLRESVSLYKPSCQLRSSDQSLFTIPRTNLAIGQRAFSWSSVFIWNSIPLSVRNAPSLPSVHSNTG